MNHTRMNSTMWLPPEIQRFGCAIKYELAEYADRLIEPKLLRKAVVTWHRRTRHLFHTARCTCGRLSTQRTRCSHNQNPSQKDRTCAHPTGGI